MGLTADNYSRFATTATVIQEGQEVYGKWNPPELLRRQLKGNEVIQYRVTRGVEGRPDLISNEIYATTELDWLIIAYNHARSALNWPKAGDVIKIPIPSLVSSELL